MTNMFRPDHPIYQQVKDVLLVHRAVQAVAEPVQILLDVSLVHP